MSSTVEQVRAFWERNPLWTGESRHESGTRAFFDEHRQVYVDDCFAGTLDPRLFPDAAHNGDVLDLGCGPGFWTIELGLRSAERLVGADLTVAAIKLAAKRAEIYGIRAEFRQENAEALTFADASFDHVNCQGVIHHTPDTEAAVREIARVIKPGGTAMVSVYYRNWILRRWPLLRLLGRLLDRLGAGMRGRGREHIFAEADVDVIVRLYDGAENPVGKSYDRASFRALLEPHFVIEETFLHFFPARALPIRLPRGGHRWLDRRLGFLIYARLRKR